MMTEQRKVVKTRKVRSFRLIDFHVYDEKWSKNSSANSSDDEEKSVEDENTVQFGRGGSSSNKYVPPKFIIQMFGINEKGETFTVFLNDYHPFFYVLVPDSWKKTNCERLCDDIRAKLGQGVTTDSIITSAEIVEYNKLYGFTAGKKSKFVKLTFPNMMCMTRVRNLWYTKDFSNMHNGQPARKFQPFMSQGAKLFLYESKLPPMLRYFHIHNVSPSGWVYIPMDAVQIPEKKTTTCKYEYICSKRHLVPQPQKETRVPYKICSFDIEASSSHGDFPVPIKSYKRPATQILDQYMKQDSVYHFAKNAQLERDCMTKMLLAIFQYGSFTDIDLVYPKWGHIPKRCDLEEKIIPRCCRFRL